MSRSIHSLLPYKKDKSSHHILNVVNYKFDEIHELLRVNDEFHLAVFKAHIERLDIQATIYKITDYFVANIYK